MSGTINILQAIEDPAIFQPWLQRFNMGAWRAFHAGVFGLPMSETEAEIYRACSGRQSLPYRRAVEVFAPVGRRGGKSANAALLAVFMTAIEDGWRRHLAPGQQGIFAIVSVDRQSCREVFNYCRGILNSSPLLKRMIAAETQDAIELTNGAVIQVRTGSFRSVRGPAYIGAVLDEIAFMRDSETSANPASEIIAAISPAIIEGGILFGISSVFNRQGVLYEAFQEHYGKDGDDVLVWKASTLTMNPGFSLKKIEREKAKDLAVALAEYESEWRDDVSSLFSSDAVDAAMVERGALPYGKDVSYFAFIDPSGGRRDSAALAIAHKDKGRVVVDFMMERPSPHDPQKVAGEFAEILKAYGIYRVHGDRYGGSWPEAAYRMHGVQYIQAEKTASELYLAALPLFSAGAIELPHSDRLRGQLCSLMRKTSAGGRDQVIVGQSDSSHADLANAVIGAIVLAVSKSSPSIGFEVFAPTDNDDEAIPTLHTMNDLWQCLSGHVDRVNEDRSRRGPSRDRFPEINKWRF